LRLDFNENTVGASPRVLQRLQQLTLEDLARYPEREPVEAVVAASLGLEKDEVLLTNGVDEGIHLLCETYLEPDNEAIIVCPHLCDVRDQCCCDRRAGGSGAGEGGLQLSAGGGAGCRYPRRRA